MGFPRQAQWSELPFPSPGDLPDPGTKPKSPLSSALAGRFFTTEPSGKSAAATTTLLMEAEKLTAWSVNQHVDAMPGSGFSTF